MAITTLKPDISATISGGGAGGTAQADKSSFTEGTDQVTPISGIFNDSLGADPTEDTTVGLRATVKRALHSNLRNVSGTEIATLTNPVRVDPTGSTTQPVSGTVTATQSTIGNLKATVTIVDAAGDSAMDGANDAVRVNVVAGGAGDGAILDGASPSIKATVLDYTNSNPLAVRLTDSNGDYVAAGGGTQYADGAASATPTGTVALGHDGSNVQALLTSAAGRLSVDVNSAPTTAVTQSGTWNITDISGTVSLPTGAATAAKQPALGTAGTASADVITVQGIASMTALKVDGSAVTQPISAASLPLPTGASTAAKQPALGTAGSASADVITIQGIASMTAVKVDGSAVTQPVSGTVTANIGTSGSLALESGGNLASVATNTTNVPNVIGTAAAAIPSRLVQIGGSDGTNARAIRTNSTGQPDIRPLTSADVVTANAGTGNFSTNTAQIAGTTTATGNGTASAGCQRVTIASDNTAFSTNAVQSGTWTVQPGNTANTTAWLVQDVPATSGGLTTHLTISAASTNATSVKGSAGQVYAIQVFNLNASARYFKLYNKSSSPTVGTDTPIKVFMIPGNSTGAGVVINFDKGVACSSGIAFALTTGIANSDTGSVAANEIIVNIDYK